MRVYFVRHGESRANVKKLHQDHTDELTDIGIKQAGAVAKRFETIDIDVIISSDYIRALNTAHEIAKVTGKKVEVSELLRERRRPSQLVGKRFDADETLRVIDLLESNKNAKDWHHSDEENDHDALERAQKLLIFLQNRKEKNILVVTHAAYLRYIATCMMFGAKITPDLFSHVYDFFRVNNTGITVCEYKEALRRTHKKDTFWRVITWNDFAHLG